jgi:hypothetical protein
MRPRARGDWQGRSKQQGRGGKVMPPKGLHPELERRVALLEKPENQGEDYDATAWVILIGLGVVLPIIALMLGR